MKYLQRDASGNPIALYANEQPGFAEEQVADDYTLPLTIAECSDALQVKLDSYAQSWGYDSIVSAASYSASTNTKFKNEAGALIAWRDSVWTWAESLTTMPASIDALITAMPAAPTRPI